MGSNRQRVVGAAVLLASGVLSLPLVASVLDGGRTENWIIPAHLLVMAAVGAGVCLVLPAMARRDAPLGTRVLTGVGWGMLAAFTGLLVFWLLLNGIRGA